MIIVDIFVPALDRTYDFKLAETEFLYVLAEEIAEMISRKEQNYIKGEVKKAILCEQNTMRILPPDKTLKELGIHTGDRLIFV